LETDQSYRRLITIPKNPNPTSIFKLDKQNLEKYNFTINMEKDYEFKSRKKFDLSIDNRTLRKSIDSHKPELKLTDLGSRIPCPVHLNFTKF
jgi:hypothetical protein